jgi:hypothetical protein
MRSRLFLVVGLFTLAAAVGVLTHGGTHGQPPPKELPPDLLPPTPIGPSAKGVVPAAAVVPAARKPAPFDRFRKYEELPELTRELVFATQRGIEWLSRDGIHQSHGRFVAGINPALGNVTEDDNFMRQAMGAFAVARAARLTGEEKYAVRAAQTILNLLAVAPKDTTDPSMRKPLPSIPSNRVGSAAHLAMAIYELPEAAPELIQNGEELCQYLRGCVQPDGSIRCTEGSDSGDVSAADGAGPALASLAMSHRARPAPWKQAAVNQGLAFYRKLFRAGPNPHMIPWMTAAAVEAHLQSKDPAAAEFVFEMIDWLRKIQYDGTDRHRIAWRGGFPTVADGKVAQTAPTIETASYAMALADACRMIRQMDRADTGRFDQYRNALVGALQFVTTLQYGEENTQHFAAHFRPALVGAFHPSSTDGNLRTDHTATAVAALCQFLIAGADK